MDTKIISSSLIAVGIIAGAFTLGNQLEQGIRGFKDADRVVTVKGLSEKEVKANHVIWPVSFREMGNDLSQVYDQLEVKQNMVLKYLKDGGLTDEEITIAAPKLRDNLADNYGSQRPPFRYMITQVLTISSDKVDVVRKLDEAQRDLLKAGVGLTNDYSYMTKYSYTGLNEIKPAMIEAATKNAKEAAQKFAMDSGSTLGKIRRANQGIFSITDRDENTPFIKNVRVVTTVEYFLKD
ncbi:SIMPL domain-containing protein [Turicimonas muris]|uniref:SIMPL domain-containing protein n=9 Tax=Turicimonas muris TaxID=1796652 RepID=A0A227KR71_9BURK|nr:SIMPL domain-containing protein [Turicimonas muris]ANU66208.1 SIMPL domain-containing protein [Burkholderiales bacterium YL45]OXE49863.1 SIMPL domain-containing protein [Turicimonas muris]QQQ97359.1 SIMPL domain-containing protein [Turicimonas muris]